MIRAAVCGLGIGMAHCAGYLSSKNTALVAVCDRIPERLDHVGGTFDTGSMLGLKGLLQEELLCKSWKELGVRTFRDLGELLEFGEFDVLSLCTPDHLHYEQALQVIERGKNLLLEKPVALNLRDARDLLEAVDRAAQRGVNVVVGYEFRENPAIRRVKELIDSGVVGRVEGVSIHHFRTPFKRDKWQHWIQERRTSGGLIVEETSHWFDLLRFLTKREISDLHCATTDRILYDFDFEDVAFVSGHFEGGSIFQIEHSLAGFDFSFTVSVYGSKGSIRCGMKEETKSSLDAGQSDYVGIVAYGDPNRPASEARSELFGSEAREPETIRQNVVAFAEKLEGADRSMCSLSDGVRALELSLLANLSAVENKVLAVKEIERIG